MRLLYIFIISTLCFLCAQAQQTVAMAVGTYTYGESKGIYTYHFDQTTGKAELLDSLELTNPSYLTYANKGRQLYAVSETNDAQASLNIIEFDAQSGSMRLLNSIPTHGEDPCYVSAKGHYALTANYSAGSMSVFRLNRKGAKIAPTYIYGGATGGPDLTRQDTPHVHCAVFAPDNKYILATDFSADRILSYRLKRHKAKANGVATRISADSGPRHLIFSNDGRYAYIMSELSGRVTTCRYDKGRLEVLQEIVADSTGARGGADIHLSPDGKFLYASHRLQADGITIYAVDSHTGLLSRIGYQPTAAHPRQFNISPNGRFLLCCCRDNDKIQVFRRNALTGLLTDTHQDIPVSKVTCVQFSPRGAL